MAGSAGGRPVSSGKPTLWLPSSGIAGGQPPVPIISAPRGAHLGPRTRFGKRAFVLATPHLAAGSRSHQVGAVILSMRQTHLLGQPAICWQAWGPILTAFVLATPHPGGWLPMSAGKHFDPHHETVIPLRGRPAVLQQASGLLAMVFQV